MIAWLYLMGLVQTTDCVSTFPTIIYHFLRFTPESIRWLRLNGRTEEATEILKKIAKVNKRPFPNARLKPLDQEHGPSPLDLFRPLHMFIRSAIIGYVFLGR